MKVCLTIIIVDDLEPTNILPTTKNFGIYILKESACVNLVKKQMLPTCCIHGKNKMQELFFYQSDVGVGFQLCIHSKPNY